jgi:hypothetical protein
MRVIIALHIYEKQRHSKFKYPLEENVVYALFEYA